MFETVFTIHNLVVAAVILTGVILLHGVVAAWYQMITSIFNYEEYNESVLDQTDNEDRPEGV